jgi:hypothetical protein
VFNWGTPVTAQNWPDSVVLWQTIPNSNLGMTKFGGYNANVGYTFYDAWVVDYTTEWQKALTFNINGMVIPVLPTIAADAGLVPLRSNPWIYLRWSADKGFANAFFLQQIPEFPSSGNTLTISLIYTGVNPITYSIQKWSNRFWRNSVVGSSRPARWTQDANNATIANNSSQVYLNLDVS